LGRSPSNYELAKSLHLSSSELFAMLDDVSSTTVLSLDELIYKEEDNRQIPRVETLENLGVQNVLGDMEKEELKGYLVQAISLLSEQERLVVALYYYEEMTLKEIGEVMQISESRVSQIHTKAVLKLKSMIRDKFAL
jgi:RNA polymerase sigma factor for flagellar operon FliA